MCSMKKIVIIGSSGAGKPTLTRDLTDDQQPEPEQENDQDSAKVRERLQDCIPDDPQSCLFTLVAIAYLIAGVIHFCHTGDPSMLTTLLASVGTYAALPRAKATLGSLRRKGKHKKYRPTSK
jgi:GTPase SAR1 family protein